MSCFPCFSSQKSKKSHSKREHGSAQQDNVTSRTTDDANPVENANIKAQTYTFRELATATKNFRQECLLGEGGFGRVYKGTIPATGQVVAVKQLDRNGMQGNKDFLAEVLALSHLNHENLVNLVGYCADGDQRLLVYEFMSGGSLEDRILDIKSSQPALDWFTRMKIASGAARGLEYLHDKANPPVVYRDLKSSNILLDNDLNPKLSDFGLAKLSGGDKMNLISPGVTGTYGYSAPEYVRTGHLSLKSDVYGFGVVLLELITGRRAIDTTRPNEEQNLISWAQPLFRDPKRFPDMADPLLGKHFPEKDLNQAVAIAAMCLQEEEAARPLMSDVVTALSFLSMVPPEVIPASLSPATSPPEESITSESEAQTASDENEDGNGDCVCSSGRSGSVSNRKSSVNGNLSQKSSSTRERDLKKRSGRKSSVRVLSQKNSMGWEGESEISGNRLSQGNISIGLISSGEFQGESVRLDRRSRSSSSSSGSQEGSIRLDHTNSAGSDKPNNVEQEHISTKG